MNPKPNDSQAEVNDNEIVIDENIGNNKPDVVEGVTAEPNYETPERKQSFFSTKKGKKVLFGIIGVVLLAVLITILVAVIPCKGDDCKCKGICPCEGDDCECKGICPSEPCEGLECPVINITYNKNDILIYEETLSKVSNIELINSKNGRRLDDNSRLTEKSTITSKYLINIYDYDEAKEVYYAYAAVVDMNKKVESKSSEKIGGNDLTKSNKVEDDVPVAKFSFTKLGTILTFNVNKNIDKVIAKYLYAFVEKAIPEVSKKSFDSSNVDETRTYDVIEGNKNNGKINTNRQSEDNENNIKEGNNWEINVNDKKVKDIKGSKSFILYVNHESQLKDENPNNFTKDIETDESVNRGTLIQQVKNDIDLNIILKDNSVDEGTTEKIKSLLEKVQFSEENYKRRLDNIDRKLGNLRNLQETTETYTYAMPVHFNYPLFKSNLLGAKVGLMADVAFIPMKNRFKIRMHFDANGKPYEVFSFEKATNFDDIVTNIQFILGEIYVVLVKEKNTVQPVLNEFELKIKQTLDQFYNEINVVPQLNDQEFSNELIRILEKVIETNANTYSETYESTNSTTREYNMILTSIQRGEESFVSSIRTTSSDAVVEFIEKNKANLDTLFNAWTKFYNDVMPELEERKSDLRTNPSLLFDIGLYYNIKDEMNAVINIYKEFGNNVESSLRIEHEQFTSEVNEKFKSMIDPSLLETEKIAEIAKNNISVIHAMNYSLSDGNGDEVRKKMITQIESFRETLEKIMKEILSQISTIYSSNLESQEFISFKNSLSVKYNQIISQQENILKVLRLFNKYDIEFDIYFDDIKILNDLEIQVYEKVKKSYKQYIGEYINGQTNYILSQTEITSIKKSITTYFTELQTLADSGQWTDAKILSEQFVTIVKDINKKYLTVEFVQKIINYYTDSKFINKMLDNYFNDLYNIYKVFNTTFYDQYYLNHAPKYVSKPTELINKLLDISYNLNPDISQLHITIQKLIETKIINDISSISTTIYQIIYEQYNTFIQNIYNRDCCINGLNFANIEIIKKNLIKFSELYYDKNGNFIQIYTYTPSTKEDAFNLKSIITQKTNEIKYNILRIVDQINIDFHATFCYGIQVECAFINVVSQIGHYYYQASKLRVSLKFLQSLVVIAQSMITENTLIDLKPEKYKELFYLELNYKETEILTDINTFLAELSIETKKYISESLEKLEIDIKSYFNTGINVAYIKEQVKTIAEIVFQDPQDFLEEIEAYYYYTCGPMNKIILAFNTEIDTNKILSENKFTFDKGAYQNSYREFNKSIEALLKEQKDLLFNDLNVPSILTDKLKTKIKDFIAQSYQFINEKVHSLTDISQFEFLTMSFSLKDITDKALKEVTDKLYSEVNNIVENTYKNYLENLKKQIKEHLNTTIDNIRNIIYFEYVGTSNYYDTYGIKFGNTTSVSYGYVINKIEDTTKDYINKAVITFFSKVKEVYSEDNLKEKLYATQTKTLVQYQFIFNNTDYSSSIINHINELYTLSYQRLVREKTLFQAQIKNFYENAFKSIISQFVNGKGKDYLIEAVNFDYENTIYHDFSLMKSAIKQTYDTVKTLLDTAELKSLGYNLIQTFNKVFPEIRDKINDIIPKKIEKVIYPKITTFKNKANNLIADLYISTLEKEGSYLKNKLSSKVFELIPTSLDNPFKGIIQNHFNEAIKNIIEDIKQSYNTKILSDLRLISDILEKYGDEVTDAISLAQVTRVEKKWTTINSYYKDLIKVHKLYETNSVFEVKSQKTTEIESFITAKIINLLINIKDGFYRQVEIGKEKMNSVLQEFRLNTLIDSTLTQVTNSNLINILLRYQNVFDQLFTDFTNSIGEKFENFPTLFKQKIDEFVITGFDKKSSRRNLDEKYDLTEIEDVLLELKKYYETFSNNILNSTNYANIAKIKSALNIGLSNDALKLTKDFYSYKVLIQQYTDNSIIDNYFEKLENEAEKISNRTMDYVSNAITQIQKTIDIIYEGRKNSWPTIRKSINDIVFETLDEVFKEKFADLKNMSGSFNDGKKQNIKIEPLYVPGEDHETLNTITFNISNINYKYGYSLKKDGDYNFKMNVYTEGDITLDIIQNVGDRIIEKISGKLGSGTIGLNADYTLHNLGLDYEAYANINEVEYLQIGKHEDEYVFFNATRSNNQTNTYMKKKIRPKYFEE